MPLSAILHTNQLKKKPMKLKTQLPLQREEMEEEDQTERRRVGVLFDERMCKHMQPGGNHPENPQRIRAIWDNLNSSGLLRRCVVLNAKEADDDHLALVHSKEHIDLIKTISSKTLKKMRQSAKKYDSVYFNKGSSEAAYLAAGFVIEAAEQVAKGELDSAFAIVRPPGHNAEESEPMGFCLLNNVAIAISVILNERSELGIKKILIVDWDVHHGNSTQKMFYKDPRVLVFSVHRHDSGMFYPKGNDGSYKMMGEGLGAGYNINVPWEGGGVGDADYFVVWDHILLPVAKEFDPELIIISAGFDAGPLILFGTATGDPIGGCCLSPFGYSIMLYKLMKFARGKIVMALEGGYNPVSLTNATEACIEMLLDYKPPIRSLKDLPLKATWPLIKTVRQALCRYWPVLADKIPDEVINSRLNIEVEIDIRQDEDYARTPIELEQSLYSGSEDYFEDLVEEADAEILLEIMAPKTASENSQKKNTAPKVKDIYRGCMDGLVTELKGMEMKKHMVELRKTPFKYLFEVIENGSLKASACKRSNTTIKKIMKSYERKTMSLSIGDQKVEITEELIRLIFGIVDGDVQIEIGKKERPAVEFVDRLYPENRNLHFKLTKRRIEKQLKAKDITSKDFARLAVLYVLAYALAPTRGYSIGWYYTQFVADVDKMCKYNWSLFLYDRLMAGINKEPKGTMGCVLILAYCLCECSRIIVPRRPSAFPRCVKWDLNELTEALKNKDIEFFFHKVKSYTRETEEETRLLHLPRIEEDEENSDTVDEPMKEEQQIAYEQTIMKLRLKVHNQLELIKKLKRQNKNLKKELAKFTMLEGGEDGGQAGVRTDAITRKPVKKNEMQKEQCSDDSGAMTRSVPGRRRCKKCSISRRWMKGIQVSLLAR